MAAAVVSSSSFFFPCLLSAVADLIVYHMMGDHLRAGKPPRFGSAPWLGSKGRYGSFHLWIDR